MSNHIKNNPVDDIIDLTEVVSIGSGVGVGRDAPHDEDDVLDSLVHEFEGNSDKKNTDEDNGLDLSNLDDLISSYNLNFDENNNQDNELDSDFDVILKDIQNGGSEGENNYSLPQDNAANAETEDTSGKADQDVLGGSENAEPFEDDDEIDVLTRDIINGTESAADVLDLDEPLTENENKELEDVPDSFFDELDKQLADGMQDSEHHSGSENSDAVNFDDIFAAANEMPLEQDTQKEDLQDIGLRDERQALRTETDNIPNELNSFHSADEKEKTSQNAETISEPPLKSDMAEEEAEDISDEAFNDILNELSLDHEVDEDVVPFAKDAAEENLPIRLNGDISFIETAEKEKPADIHLVQSASKVLDSDEAYLEKFGGEDESVGAKLKTLSSNFASLEHRLIGSDSKWQDMGLEINYRIGGLEKRVSELEENTKTELSHLKAALDKFSQNAAEASEQNVSAHEDSMKKLQEKVSGLESRVATLDDIFSEQKMLNDELAKTLDNQSSSADSSEDGQVKALQEQVAALRKELGQAQAKISMMEENIEKMASLAAAKVLREEIIPLLTKE